MITFIICVANILIDNLFPPLTIVNPFPLYKYTYTFHIYRLKGLL